MEWIFHVHIALLWEHDGQLCLMWSLTSRQKGRKETRPANCTYLVRRLQPEVWTLADLGWLLPRHSLKRTFAIFLTRGERHRNFMIGWLTTIPRILVAGMYPDSQSQ
jgi:hypothetical protein